MTTSGVLLALVVVLAGAAFVTVGRWGAAHPERLVAAHVPAPQRPEQAARVARSARRSQVLGVSLLCLALLAAVVGLV